MLSGIKIGKRKKAQSRLKDPPHPSPAAGNDPILAIAASTQKEPTTKRSNENNNESVAEQLRRSLLSGSGGPESLTDRKFNSTAGSSLEARGRIKGKVEKDRAGEKTVVLLNQSRKSTDAAAARGTRPDGDNEQDMTVAEMLVQEQQDKLLGYTGEERDVRNILRNTKKRRKLASVDSDDERVEQMQSLLKESSSKKSAGKVERRDRARALAHHDQLQAIASQCWWWLDAPTFQRYRLLALGDLVSLVWTPANLSVGLEHFYLVPIQHAPSLTVCEDDVWNEIQQFQSSLTALYAKEDKLVLFTETVLPSNKFWQTKMEVIIVPCTAGQDTPLFFKSALAEQAEEWGTHQKLLDTTVKGGLRRTIPPNFPYFYFQMGKQACAQLIESSNFPKDFAVETVLGMMQQDPIRFRRKEQINEKQERERIQRFLTKWKPHDWTLQLD